jgi:hypothetical protein
MKTIEIASDAELDGALTSRGSFLRRFGATVAIGMGVALIPATKAYAAKTTCCRDLFSCCDCNCTTGFALYCTGGCPPCCSCFGDRACHTFFGGCIC